MKKVLLFLICFSSFGFSEPRFQEGSERSENVLLEILEVLNQIKGQNEQLVKVSKMIHEIANTYSYILDEPIHEAFSD